MKVRLYVEGGGDHNKALQSDCRRGFRQFLERAGLKNRMPRVTACGGRKEAFKAFRKAHQGSQDKGTPVLLVDSEEPIASANGCWDHVKQRKGDHWERPNGATDDQLHFMVQTMEAWFHADKETLEEYYGQHFRGPALSQRADIENIPKANLLSGLRQATKSCQKGEYSKGKHSFEILERLDPAKVRKASAHADRLLTVLDRLTER